MARNLVLVLCGALTGLILGAMTWGISSELFYYISLMDATDSTHDYLVIAHWIGLIITPAAIVLLMFWTPLHDRSLRALTGSRTWRKFLRRWSIRLGVVAGAFLGIAIIFNLISPRVRMVTAGLLSGERFSDYRPTRFWISQLASPNVGDRSRAALVLVHMQAAETVASVGECLRDDSSEVRKSAVDALCSIGPAAKFAAGDLARLLKDNDPDVRLTAAKSLKQIGPAGCEAIPELIAMSKGTSVNEAHAAIEAMAAMTPDSIPAIVQVLVANGESADAFASALDESGRTAAPVLLSAWESSSGRSRRAIARVLAGLRPLPERALPSVTELLRDSEYRDKAKALTALGRAGAQSLPTVMPYLNDSDPEIKAAAVDAVGEMGPAAKTATASLAALVGNSDAGIRGRAVISLGQIGPAAKEAAASLHSALNDKEPWVRIHAAAALWKLDEDTEVVVPFLASMLKSDIDESAAIALSEIGPPARAAIPALIEALNAAPDNSYVAQAIHRIAPRTYRESAVPIMTRQFKLLLAKHGNRSAVDRLIRSLGKFEPEADGVIPVLCEALSSKDHWEVAASTLGSMGPVAKEFVPALKAMYARQDSGDQRKTLEALSKIDPTAVTRISAWNKWWPVVLATMIFCGLTVIAAILPAVITWWRGPRTEQPPSPKSAV